MTDALKLALEALEANEALRLASVLRGMTECGSAPSDLWDRDQPDGDPFVVWAAELLEALAAPQPAAPDLQGEIDRLKVTLANLLAENVEQRDMLEFVERWANHHGTKSKCTAQEALSCIQHYPPIKAITESYRDGKVPETFDPYAEIERLKAAPAPAQAVNPLDALLTQILAAARALNKLTADACNVDEADHWKLYGNSQIIDASTILRAAHGIQKPGSEAC